MKTYNHESRAQFEDWLRGTSGFKRCVKHGCAMWFTTLIDGSYRDFRVNDRWMAWIASIKIREIGTEKKA